MHICNYNIAFVNSERLLAKSRVDILLNVNTKNFFLYIYFFVLNYKKNVKHFSVLIYSYTNTRGNCENSKLCENTAPSRRPISAQFPVFPITTRVDT
jgi:hypothetical protein